jgi:HIV-1 Vpr-binding protein
MRLMRSVACLDSTNLLFNSTGDVAYAFARRTSDDLAFSLQARRNKHPLHTAFRTVNTPPPPALSVRYAQIPINSRSQS